MMSVEIVVKIGGGVLASAQHLTTVLATVAAAARHQRILVIPGGGPFADAVREVDRRLGLGDDAAHWMAVLGMEQCAHLIAARTSGGVLAESVSEIGGAIAAGRLPVFAPYRWVRAADPLPHSWDVTSDSIAAWVAGLVGARRLVLVKPAASCAGLSPTAPFDALVDRYFARALPDRVAAMAVGADQIERLERCLCASDNGEDGAIASCASSE